ncbi:phosphate acyltransferase PlsX [Paenalkalicoccus suaedae]|uniref:Phosphate acyltransferase n=1 Tax=Paenalkalicoccus suaedae TaxID=2592382 RepID=A0A859FEU3_9BACI|nr:phosphate acyltransferase PlsX [Paenalkalicoccus suaedae]QKS71471.1 phosphate acyltransferase PlsX [Paenalkalicoccus suaedae]
MRLAVDAMGGDNAPKSIIDGCVKALAEFPSLSITLFGDQEKINEHVTENDRLTIVHTSVVIDGEDSPVRAVRRKKDSSMVMAVQAVKDNAADAAVSAGNTGALMTAGLLVIGRTAGIERPALSPMLPTRGGEGFLLLDVGANMDAKTSHLVQYALMGHIYMQKVRGLENPRVGLLNIGSEPGKGSDLVKRAYTELQGLPINFIGNVESRDLLEGAADVVICDGFSGNLVLKTIEGTAMSLFSIMKEEFTSSTKNKLAAGLLRPSFKKIKNKMDYSEYGGAGLFGLKAPVIKAHGSSDSQAFFSAIRQAKVMHEEDVIPLIEESINKLPKREEEDIT